MYFLEGRLVPSVRAIRSTGDPGCLVSEKYLRPMYMLSRPVLAGSMITILLLLQGDRDHLYKDRLPEMPPFEPRMAGSKSLSRFYVLLWTFHLPEIRFSWNY